MERHSVSQRQESIREYDPDFGLLYRPIRFRSVAPAGLYRAPSDPSVGPQHVESTTPETQATYLQAPPNNSRPSPPPARLRSPVRVNSRSPSILRDYTPTKLRWKSEDPARSDFDVLSAVRRSRVTPEQPPTEEVLQIVANAVPPTQEAVMKPPRFASRPRERVRSFVSPSLKYALLIVATQEVEDRAAIDTEELAAFSEIIQAFRYAVEMELVRMAAFKLFRLERGGRVSLAEQEARERGIIDLWQWESLQDVQLRRTIGWHSSSIACITAGPGAAATKTLPISKPLIAHASLKRSSHSSPRCSPVSIAVGATEQSDSPCPTPDPSSIRSSPSSRDVCDEVEIGDETGLQNSHVTSFPSPDFDRAASAQERPRSVPPPPPEPGDDAEPLELFRGPNDDVGASWCQDPITSMLLQEQLLDEKISRQHAETLRRASYLPKQRNASLDNKCEYIRDGSQQALRRRLAALFEN